MRRKDLTTRRIKVMFVCYVVVLTLLLIVSDKWLNNPTVNSVVPKHQVGECLQQTNFPVIKILSVRKDTYQIAFVSGKGEELITRIDSLYQKVPCPPKLQ